MTTKTLKTKLTVLAFAAAALTTTTMLTGSASALGLAEQGHGPVVTGAGPIKQPSKPAGGVVSCQIGTGCVTPQKPPATGVIPPRQGFPAGGTQTTGVNIPPRQGFPVGGTLPPLPKPPITGGGNPPPKPPTGGNGGTKGGNGGVVVSCHPGTGCTVTGGDRDGDHDRDHDHDYDRDHDRDYDRDRDHDHDYGYYRWYRYGSYYPWNYTYDQTCSYYDYKWESVYVPGYGLRRELVKVCSTY